MGPAGLATPNSRIGHVLQHAPAAEELTKLPFISQLRPSTLLGYLVSCAPPQLPSPYDTSGVTAGKPSTSASASASELVNDLLTYVNEINNVYLSRDKSTHSQVNVGDVSTLSVRMLYSSNTSDWRRIPGELKAWGHIQQSLEVFFQRISVADSAHKNMMRSWYEVILDIGSNNF